MSKSKELIVTQEDIPNVIDDVYRRMWEIPLGNSAFQNKNFVMGSQYTPCRSYRGALLRLSDRIRALNEARFSLETEKIDLEELDYKINHSKTDQFERRRLEVEKRKKLSQVKYTEKLIYDALYEVTTLYNEIKEYPEYTREEFEAEERIHFEIRLQRQIEGKAGAVDSLLNMTQDRQRIDGLLALNKQYETLLKSSTSNPALNEVSSMSIEPELAETIDEVFEELI